MASAAEIIGNTGPAPPSEPSAMNENESAPGHRRGNSPLRESASDCRGEHG